ncbi:unnamed protein product, partial [Protopolystoma xenopodis]
RFFLVPDPPRVWLRSALLSRSPLDVLRHSDRALLKRETRTSARLAHLGSVIWPDEAAGGEGSRQGLSYERASWHKREFCV